MKWRWLSGAGVLAMHAEQIAEHGGGVGIRDAGLLDSALARPLQLEAYRPRTGVHRLAAAYAFGIARNHPFVDGNKRTALVASATFLELNGWSLTATEPDAVATFLALAAGEIDEVVLARWLRTQGTKAR